MDGVMFVLVLYNKVQLHVISIDFILVCVVIVVEQCSFLFKIGVRQLVNSEINPTID